MQAWALEFKSLASIQRAGWCGSPLVTLVLGGAETKDLQGKLESWCDGLGELCVHQETLVNKVEYN